MASTMAVYLRADERDLENNLSTASVEESGSDSDSDSAAGHSDDSGSEEVIASRPPTADDLICGVDKRPYLPTALFASTVLGGVWVLANLTDRTCFLGALSVYVVTLICMLRAATVDPGQIEVGPEEPLPPRAHRSWLLPKPVLRYDHYCRFLAAVIGLRNHREFVATLGGLLLIAAMGFATDAWVAAHLYLEGKFTEHHIVVLPLLAFHLFYSGLLVKLVLPVANIHSKLVSRNELCDEWKRNSNYVCERAGEFVPVNSLNTDEFNENFENFVYDPSRNQWDRGCFANCMAFWFTPRYSDEEMGAF